MALSDKEVMAYAAGAGVAGGAVLSYPGALIGAWALAAYLNRGKGLKKIAIAGGLGTVVGLAATKALWAAKSAQF